MNSLWETSGLVCEIPSHQGPIEGVQEKGEKICVAYLKGSDRMMENTAE
jgi:hypothetical protein